MSGRAPLLGSAFLMATVCFASAGEPEASGARAVVERRLSMMGTALAVEVEAADRAAALAASERAVAALAAAEARLSTWRTDTEMARLNGAPAGERVAISEELAADLAGARWCWAETDGAFDPTVGALVKAWGLREGGRAPSAGEVARARAATGMADLRMVGDGVVRTRADVIVEEGGFGKGAGLRDALAALRAAGVSAARLDLGGQVAVLGGGERVAVADPRRRERVALEMVVGEGSVSTSGNSERGILVEGVRMGHLLDPRTGRPAPDFGSVTVWASDPLRADCLSTGLYVMGPERAMKWAARHPEVAVLVLVARGEERKAFASANLRGRIDKMDPEVKVSYGSPREAR